MKKKKLPGVSKRGARFVVDSMLTDEVRKDLLAKSNATAAMVRRPFQNYCEIVVHFLRQLGYVKMPDLDQLRNDFDNNVHPKQAATKLYENSK